MRAVIYARNSEVEVADRPVPEFGPDDILLKIGGAGVCHSDITIIGMGDDNPWVGGTLGPPWQHPGARRPRAVAVRGRPGGWVSPRAGSPA